MSKKYMIINGERVEFTNEKNVLDVVRNAGIDLPTFCYHSELSVYGACRMCIVEDHKGDILTSCSTPPKNGMEIRTHTPKLQRHRKMIIKLLLASHNRECTSCRKSGKCDLQEIAKRFGIREISFDKSQKAYKDEYKIDRSTPALVKDPNKCIQCGDCVRVCSETQNVGAVDFALRGYELMVSPAFDIPLAETDCVNCGQCVAVCPTAALTIKDDTQKVWDAIYDKKKRVIVQVAPAVRVALGEEFGYEAGENVMPLMVAALRKLGFDEIYDTSLSADLTVMEESAEFLEKVTNGFDAPLFTSCCPAWVKYVEKKHPDLMGNISSCKSPMQMFGAVAKEYYTAVENDGREPFVVAVMPCTAKKGEVSREEFEKNGIRDTDVSITTQELAAMIIEAGIRFEELEPEALDMTFGMYSGAGLIFGVTGGVTEAVIRRVAQEKSYATLKNIEFIGVRGLVGVKEAIVPLGEKELKIAVVNGLKNADDLIMKIKNKEAYYDFVEVMACPNGCINGGGQPQGTQEDVKARSKGMYSSDKLSQIRFSEKNPVVIRLYKGMLKDKSKELLHVHYHH